MAEINKKENPFTSNCDLSLRKKLANCYILIIALCGVETWTLGEVEQKYW
jgi:hypothetical protein